MLSVGKMLEKMRNKQHRKVGGRGLSACIVTMIFKGIAMGIGSLIPDISYQCFFLVTAFALIETIFFYIYAVLKEGGKSDRI